MAHNFDRIYGSLVRCALALVFLCACGISSPVSRELGAQCADRDECDDRCLTGAQFPDGMCSLSCEENSDCPGGSRCVDLEGGVCLFVCQSTANCSFLGEPWTCEIAAANEDGAEVMVCIGPTA